MPTYYVKSGEIDQKVIADDANSAVIRTLSNAAKQEDVPCLGMILSCGENPKDDDETLYYDIHHALKLANLTDVWIKNEDVEDCEENEWESDDI